MERFQWHEKYSVNNEELDNHHKTILDIINRLYRNILDNDATGCFDLIVDELISYTDYHFTAEEQYMKKTGYRDIDRHVSEHTYFTQRIVHFKNVTNTIDSSVTKALLLFLGNWILHHVMNDDKKISVLSPAAGMPHHVRPTRPLTR
jgi:hemerythrin